MNTQRVEIVGNKEREIVDMSDGRFYIYIPLTTEEKKFFKLQDLYYAFRIECF